MRGSSQLHRLHRLDQVAMEITNDDFTFGHHSIEEFCILNNILNWTTIISNIAIGVFTVVTFYVYFKHKEYKSNRTDHFLEISRKIMDADLNKAQCYKDLCLFENSVLKTYTEYEALKYCYLVSVSCYLDSYDDLCVIYINKQLNENEFKSRFEKQIKFIVETVCADIKLETYEQAVCKEKMNPKDEIKLDQVIKDVTIYKDCSYYSIFLVYSILINSDSEN